MKKASSDTNSERLRIHEYYEVFFFLLSKLLQVFVLCNGLFTNMIGSSYEQRRVQVWVT